MPYTVPDWPVLAAFTLLAIALLAALAGQRRLALGVAVPASAVALWAGAVPALATGALALAAGGVVDTGLGIARLARFLPAALVAGDAG